MADRKLACLYSNCGGKLNTAKSMSRNSLWNSTQRRSECNVCAVLVPYIASVISLICKPLYRVTFAQISFVVLMMGVEMCCSRCLYVDVGKRPETNFRQLNYRFWQTVAPSDATSLQSSPPSLLNLLFSHNLYNESKHNVIRKLK